MSTTNYFDTFIAVADDSSVQAAEAPPIKDPVSAARIQYDMLVDHPYEYTSDDVIYASNGQRHHIKRPDFFARPQACLRSSPLTKRYGWGIHSNKAGKIALYPVESNTYRELANDTSVKQLKAMRSKRA